MRNVKLGFYYGDLRSVYMANYFSKNNQVYTYNINNAKLNNNVNMCDTPEELFSKADIIIPPVSLFINNEEAVEVFCRYLKSHNTVFGGCFPITLITYMHLNDINYYDYMENEEFVQYNTIATAEGCISTLISETDVNISECKVLIMGYGRCAKTLAKKLKGLCYKIGICARKDSDIKDSNLKGYTGLNISQLYDKINEYQIIVNTIPSLVLDKEVLFKVSSDTLIVDIASKPGGVDYEYCKNHRIKAMNCPGLPGKYAPRSTALFLCRLLSHIIIISE